MCICVCLDQRAATPMKQKAHQIYSENDIASYTYDYSSSDSTTSADDSEAEDSNSVNDRLTDSSVRPNWSLLG